MPEPRQITDFNQLISADPAAAKHLDGLLSELRSGAPGGGCEDQADPIASLVWAASGAMALTGRSGETPRLAPGAVASAARAAGHWIAALAPGRGFEAWDWPALLAERAALAGLSRAGDRSAGGAARLLRARDGWLVANLPRADDWTLVPAWLEAPELERRLGRSDDRSAGWAAIGARLREGPRSAWIDRGRLIGLAISPVRDAVDASVPICRISQEALCPRAVARPRVLDLTALWAGPLATSLLARAGWDVLKVESPSRPDGARHGPRAFFDLLNGDKQSAALDLRDPADRDVFERLLDAADVVVESARPRALAQLGYDAGSWLAAHPGRTWVSITGHGRAHEWIAFGDDAACAAGLAVRSASGGAPTFCGDAIADPLTGLHVAAIVLARAASGRGGLLDFSLVDVAARCGAQRVLPARVPQVCGNDRLELDGVLHPIRAPRARRPRATAPALRGRNGLGDVWRRPAC